MVRALGCSLHREGGSFGRLLAAPLRLPVCLVERHFEQDTNGVAAGQSQGRGVALSEGVNPLDCLVGQADGDLMSRGAHQSSVLSSNYSVNR